MPELIEIEIYRRALAPLVGSRLQSIEASRLWAAKAPGLAALVGSTLTEVDRVGKLLLVRFVASADAAGKTDSLPGEDRLLGIRAGMTGRVIVDGDAPIGSLRYGAPGVRDEWVRSRWVLVGPQRTDRRSPVVHTVEWVDPRHLGRLELPPRPERLGPDATTASFDDVSALAVGNAAIKSSLMNQARIAGLGNLLTDEVLWVAGIDPRRPAGSLDRSEVVDLHAAIGSTIDELSRLGGSHTGRASAPRNGDPRCECGAEWVRAKVGGRTTWWCPTCQPPDAGRS